jgi:hypothetical protein
MEQPEDLYEEDSMTMPEDDAGYCMQMYKQSEEVVNEYHGVEEEQ